VLFLDKFIQARSFFFGFRGLLNVMPDGSARPRRRPRVLLPVFHSHVNLPGTKFGHLFRSVPASLSRSDRGNVFFLPFVLSLFYCRRSRSMGSDLSSIGTAFAFPPLFLLLRVKTSASKVVPLRCFNHLRCLFLFNKCLATYSVCLSYFEPSFLCTSFLFIVYCRHARHFFSFS